MSWRSEVHEGERVEFRFLSSASTIATTQPSVVESFEALEADTHRRMIATGDVPIRFCVNALNSPLAHGTGPVEIALVVLDDVGRVLTVAAVTRWLAHSSRLKSIISALTSAIENANSVDPRFDSFRLTLDGAPIDPLLLEQWLRHLDGEPEGVVEN